MLNLIHPRYREAWALAALMTADDLRAARIAGNVAIEPYIIRQGQAGWLVMACCGDVAPLWGEIFADATDPKDTGGVAQ